MPWKKIVTFVLQSNVAGIVLIVLLFFAYVRYAPDSLKPWSNAPTPPAGQAPAPKPVEKIKRVYVEGPTKVEVIEKVVYVEKVPGVLTPATAADDNAHVIASAEIPPYNGKTIATAILETHGGVGKGRIETKQLPPPFWSLKKEFGLRAGAGSGGLIVGEVYARPLRMGPVEVEVRGYVRRTDADGADFGGAVLLDYRF